MAIRKFFIFIKTMKLFPVFGFLLFLPLLLGCNRDSQDNPRAYIEGKITGNNFNLQEITINIISNNTKVAETKPDQSGSFVLSGPLISDSYSLGINRKIKSFSASKPGCEISPDSLQIIIPKGHTYLIFNEIKLE